MAYGYYQPMYQPQAYYQPQQPQAQMQQQPQSGIVWVDSYQDAAMFPIAPNSAVALWDKSAPSVYLKKSDMTGRPSMVIYDLVERREQPAKQNTEQGVPYATKTDLKDVLDVVDDLKRQLDEMRLKTQNNAPEEVL